MKFDYPVVSGRLRVAESETTMKKADALGTGLKFETGVERQAG